MKIVGSNHPDLVKSFFDTILLVGENEDVYKVSYQVFYKEDGRVENVVIGSMCQGSLDIASTTINVDVFDAITEHIQNLYL